ncbi:energy transducer TonB [Uliginosibacterium sp. TH139]|uniref:energy transducer TonB n=1 Tax=Uliginosibacterium sp. TH139 TaxID=2067453 RepID=UPI000C7AD309|nr:hypothetical protein [Uliginosibacterium sp. TH139]PLK49433.1 hypothetical protein C0V76_09610 [Uliginosibacterium sp. TH139]
MFRLIAASLLMLALLPAARADEAPLAAASPPAEAAAPRTIVVALRSREARLAFYREACLQQILSELRERVPRDAAGKVAHGKSLLSLEVAADGRLVASELIQPDTSAALNAALLQSVQAAAPYPAFSPALSKDYDHMVLILPFNFGD